MKLKLNWPYAIFASLFWIGLPGIAAWWNFSPLLEVFRNGIPPVSLYKLAFSIFLWVVFIASFIYICWHLYASSHTDLNEDFISQPRPWSSQKIIFWTDVKSVYINVLSVTVDDGICQIVLATALFKNSDDIDEKVRESVGKNSSNRNHFFDFSNPRQDRKSSSELIRLVIIVIASLIVISFVLRYILHYGGIT